MSAREIKTSARRIEWVLQATRVPAFTASWRTVLLELAASADHRTGENARPGVRRLRDLAGVDDRTVKRALQAGIEHDVIRVAFEAPGRTTIYTVGPFTDPQVSDSNGHHRPAESDTGVGQVSDGCRTSPDVPRRTTGSSQSSPRDGASVFSPSPTTAGEGETHPHLSDLTAEARAFVADLASLACVGAPNDAELGDLADIAAYGARHERYQRITGRQFFDSAKVKNTQTMRARAADIFASAVHAYGFAEVPF